MTNKDLANRIHYLFDRNWDEDLSDEALDQLQQDADDLVAKYGWDNVYPAAIEYLHTNCLTPEQAVNFACYYWTYGWYEHPIPDPHKFLGYFYYRTNFETGKYDSMDILDSLATTILPKAGFSEADLVLNTQYMPENDPKIKYEVDLLKASEQ